MSKKTPKNITGENYHIMVGNALDRLKELPDNSVDSIVTDPPYGLSDNKFVAETIAKWIEGEREFIPDGKGFMGKAWDAFVPPPAIWDECMRVLKPGGHLLAFFGTRTQDIGALAIRLAGFEIRDSVAWLYGSGFPKSLDISKAIDKAAGAERKIIGSKPYTNQNIKGNHLHAGHTNERINTDITAPSTDAAKQYAGWGTALKPAHEPIVVARKPLSEGTVANNVLQWGTGGLNIDASRVGTTDDLSGGTYGGTFSASRNPDGSLPKALGSGNKGRFPANLILSHSEDCQDNQCVPGCPVAKLDEQSGVLKSGVLKPHKRTVKNPVIDFAKGLEFIDYTSEANQGGASRFFYVAKANKKDRNEGLDRLPETLVHAVTMGKFEYATLPDGSIREAKPQPRQNFHPTVKPTALMEYLVRLVTPEGGTVLDPFTGSGSTGKAAILGGFKFIGCELTEDYLPIIEGRLSWAEANKEQYQADKVEAAQKVAKVEQNTRSKATGAPLTALDAAEVALQAVAKKKGLESNTALPLFDDEEGAE